MKYKLEKKDIIDYMSGADIKEIVDIIEKCTYDYTGLLNFLIDFFKNISYQEYYKDQIFKGIKSCLE